MNEDVIRAYAFVANMAILKLNKIPLDEEQVLANFECLKTIKLHQQLLQKYIRREKKSS